MLRIAGIAQILEGSIGLQIKAISNCNSGMDCAELHDKGTIWQKKHTAEDLFGRIAN